MGRNKILIAAILSTVIAGVGLAGADTTTVSPATNPASASAAPVVPDARPRVLVIPFTALNVPDGEQWIAKAVQEDVISDLGRLGGYMPFTTQSQVVVEDNATAAKLGKETSAAFVVRGAVQQVDNNVRLTGQVIDTSSGDTVQTASVTGPLPQLLRLEDELSAQLRGVVAGTNGDAASAPVATSTTPAEQGTLSSPTAPQVVYVPADTTTTYNPPYAPTYIYNDYPDEYPGYYSGGYYDYPVFIGGSFGFGRFGFHGGGFHGRGGFNGGHGGGSNQFHSPSTFSGGGAFSTPRVFNSSPAFSSRAAFNTVGSGGFSSGGFSHGFGGGFSGGGFSGGFHGGGGHR